MDTNRLKRIKTYNNIELNESILFSMIFHIRKQSYGALPHIIDERSLLIA